MTPEDWHRQYSELMRDRDTQARHVASLDKELYEERQKLNELEVAIENWMRQPTSKQHSEGATVSEHRTAEELTALAQREAHEPTFARSACTLLNGNCDYGAFGLSKREYFAGLAMQAGISAYAPFRDFDELALMSVAAADALLKELIK